jgi:hypothetical protein
MRREFATSLVGSWVHRFEPCIYTISAKPPSLHVEVYDPETALPHDVSNVSWDGTELTFREFDAACGSYLQHSVRPSVYGCDFAEHRLTIEEVWARDSEHAGPDLGLALLGSHTSSPVGVVPEALLSRAVPYGVWEPPASHVVFSVKLAPEGDFVVEGVDTSDGERLRIQDVIWHSPVLQFTAVTPSNGYAVKIELQQSAQDVEHVHARVELRDHLQRLLREGVGPK